MAIYAARQRRMQAAGIKYIYRMMERSDDGTLVEAKAPKPVAKEEESSSDEEEDEYKEFMSEDDSEDSESNFSDDEEEKKVNSEPEKKSRIFFCLDERLFSQNCTFTSKVCVIAVCYCHSFTTAQATNLSSFSVGYQCSKV